MHELVGPAVNMYGNNSQHQTAGATSGSLNTYGYAGTAVASESTLKLVIILFLHYHFSATYQSYLQAYGGNSTYSPTTYSNASAFGAAMVENYGSGYGQGELDIRLYWKARSWKDNILSNTSCFS